jgi:hypothetical protein
MKIILLVAAFSSLAVASPLATVACSCDNADYCAQYDDYQVSHDAVEQAYEPIF